MNNNLLAGPILRRVTPNIVCVWLATDRQLNLSLTVLKDGTSIGVSKNKEINQCRLGKHLYIYLLQANTIDKDSLFPLDTLLNYQIEINNKKLDLKALNLTYAGASNPSFFIPSQIKNLLQGSCRKPHGSSTDALGLGDVELEITHNDIHKRPALLLLTGDQIYADDVSDSLLSLLKDKAVELLGYQELLAWETLPESRYTRLKQYIKSLFKKNTKPEINQQQLFDPSQLLHRKSIAKKQAGFSSTQRDNHLLTFGEYAMMYLFVFGNTGQWLPDFSLEQNTSKREALKKFHTTLPKVRRLLANIPTYMICDDHDVTDDWNITAAWYDKVRNLVLGRRVVANALASYWAFQAWGNAPENFDDTFIQSIADYLAVSPSAPSKLAEQFDLNMWKYRGWSFSIPSNPPIVVIDSRTQRQPDGNNYPPQLLDRYALDWLRTEWAYLLAKREQEIDNDLANDFHPCPIFVTTTPVMGFAPIEGLQQFVLWVAGTLEDSLIIRTFESWFNIQGIVTSKIINGVDAEAWTSNRDGFAKFLNCMLHRMNIDKCVFLSGDVHYSFSSKANFSSNNKTLQCWQLTSSALCNKPSAKNRFDTINKLVNQNNGNFSHKHFSLSASKRWQSNGEYITLEDRTLQQRVTPKQNIGLVEFDDKGPIKHTLLNAENPEVFILKSKT
ncbi:MAG: alkaline phosphatase D family protein [Methylococcales bacterium]|nr:alkaline phosphatase D family protein [Methylococcales bacterium]